MRLATEEASFAAQTRGPSPALSPKGARKGLADLFDLAVFELDRGGAAEDRDGDLQALALFVHILDRPVEGGERAVGDLDGLADVEADGTRISEN
jgi:hypothetical protein